MRIINAIIAGLIFGFLFGASLTDGFSTRPSAYRRDRQRFRPTTPSVAQKLMRFLEQKCVRNGGTTALYSASQSYSLFITCVASSKSTTYPKLELFNRRSENPGEFFASYCSFTPAVEKCTRSFIESLKLCLDDEEKKTVEIINDMNAAAREFMCQRGGMALSEFFESGSAECFSSKTKALQNCSAPFVSSYAPSDSSLGRIGERLVINSQDCANFQTFNKCVVNVLRECENPNIANFMESLSIAALKPTPCAYSLTTQESPVTEIPGPDMSQEAAPKQSISYSSFEEKCNVNHGPTAYFIAMESIGDFDPLLRQLLLLPLGKAVGSRLDRVQANLTSKALCRRAPLLRDLEKYLTSSVGPCLEPREREFLKIIDDVTSLSLDFVCYNEGERLAIAFHPGIRRCPQSEINIVLGCLRQTLGFNVENLFQVPAMLTRHDASFVSSAELCTNLQKFRAQTLEECSDQKLSNSLLTWFDSIENAMSCKSSIQLETSSTTEWVSRNSTERPHQFKDSEVLSGSIPSVSSWGEMHGFSESYLRDCCLRNGGEPAYEAAKEIPRYVTDGIDSLHSNLVQLISDIDIAESRNELSFVFMKYCYEVPALEEHIKHIAGMIKPCVEPKSRDKVDVAYNIINTTLEFMCENEGKRLTNFVGTDGVDCLASKYAALQNCMPSFGDAYGSFIAGDKECRQVSSAKSCIVEVLEKCPNKTPASIIEELLNTVSAVTPCNEMTELPFDSSTPSPLDFPLS